MIRAVAVEVAVTGTDDGTHVTFRIPHPEG